MNRCDWNAARGAAGIFGKIATVAFAALAGAVLMPGEARAVSVDAFLISEHEAPTSSTGPFSVTTTTVYELGLTSSGGAVAYSPADNFTFDIDQSLSYAGAIQLGRIDVGEVGAGTASYIESEVSSWDNVNIAGPSLPSDQIDFGRNSAVIFALPDEGVTSIVLAEVGGLNPYELFLCDDIACTTAMPIFEGISTSIQNSLLAETGLGIPDDDPDAIDQTWLFMFSEPVFNYIMVMEADDRGTYLNRRVQMDYIGVKLADVEPPIGIPGPAGLPLLAGGLGLLAWLQVRRAG